MLCFSVSMVLDPSQCFCSQAWPAERWQVQQRMKNMTLTSLPLEVVLVVSELPDSPRWTTVRPHCFRTYSTHHASCIPPTAHCHNVIPIRQHLHCTCVLTVLEQTSNHMMLVSSHATRHTTRLCNHTACIHYTLRWASSHATHHTTTLCQHTACIHYHSLSGPNTVLDEANLPHIQDIAALRCKGCSV